MVTREKKPMAKNGQKAARERGERLLQEWGIGDELEALWNAWGRSLDGDAAIVARLERRGDPQAAALLAELEKTAASKTARREVRRALFRLRQRGIETPLDRQAEAAAPVFAPPLEGYLTPSGDDGQQLLWLVRPVTGGILALETIVHESHGMLRAALERTSRKDLRCFWERLRERLGLHVVPIDWRYADWRMYQAYGRAVERRTDAPRDYPTLRTSLVARAASEVPHPALALLAGESSHCDPAVLTASRDLLPEPEVERCCIPEEVSEFCKSELEAADSSPLLLSDFQVADRIARIERSCLERLFAARANGRWARWLLDLAWVFHHTARPAAARQALAVGLALQEGNPPPDEIPFCQGFARLQVLRAYAARKKEQAEQRPTSLIVAPQEAQREALRAAGRLPRDLRTR